MCLAAPVSVGAGCVGLCVPARLRQAGECVTTIWGRPRGLARAEPAPGAAAAALLPPQPVRSLPGDRAARKVAGCGGSKRSDVLEVSGGPRPPLGACFGDLPLPGVLCAGWWVQGRRTGCGPSVVFQRAGEVQCRQRGGTSCGQCLGGQGQHTSSGSCPCVGSSSGVGVAGRWVRGGIVRCHPSPHRGPLIWVSAEPGQARRTQCVEG